MVTDVKTIGEVMIVTIEGRLEIEQTQPLRDMCLKHLKCKNIVFNLCKTEFVGSTGIQAFLDTISGLSKSTQDGVRVVTARSEFKRILNSLELPTLKIFDDESAAMGSFEII